MKRLILVALLLLAVPAGVARAAGLGVGLFGGMSYPVLQDDTDNGKLVGFRAPIRLVPMFAVEPYYASSNLDDKVTSVAGINYTREGFDEKLYGVNALLQTGGPVSFFPFAGIGRTNLKRTGYDRTLTHYSAGAGLAISAVPKLSIDVRGELQAIVDGSTTRKFGNVTAGLTYAMFSLP